MIEFVIHLWDYLLSIQVGRSFFLKNVIIDTNIKIRLYHESKLFAQTNKKNLKDNYSQN